MTEQEKQERLAELREKVKAKRANQAIVDKEEHKRNEVRFTLLDAFLFIHIYTCVCLIVCVCVY